MGMVSQIAERKREMAAKATNSTSDRQGFIQLRPVPTPYDLTPRERDRANRHGPRANIFSTSRASATCRILATRSSVSSIKSAGCHVSRQAHGHVQHTYESAG